MRKIATFLALLALVTAIATPAIGQVPGFPQTLPANSVVGRLGIGPGPSQAIPFATLRTQMIGSVPAGSTTVTGGSVLRSDSDRWVDAWTSAPEIGVDCTGVADSTAAIQAFFESYRTGGTTTGKLMFPSSCKVTITDTIVMGSMSGAAISGPFFAGDGAFFDFPNLSSPHFYWRGTNGGTACTSGGGNVACKYMFDFTNNDHPIVQNISFNAGGNHADGYQCPDGFLRFDGDGGTFTPTNGQIIGNSFGNGNCRVSNFVAVNLAPTSVNNHENYIVHNNVITCGGVGGLTFSATDAVTNGSTTITSATAPFLRGWAPNTITGITNNLNGTYKFLTSASAVGLTGMTISVSGVTPSVYNGTWFVDSSDATGVTVFITKANHAAWSSGGTVAGQKIRVANSANFLETTVATYVSTSNITLANAASWTSGNNQLIVAEAGFGVGVRNGASQNAIQQQISKIQYAACSVGIQMQGGGAQISQPSGGASDVGVLIGGFLAQNTSVDFFAPENDVRGIVISAGAVPPITISNGRFSNAQQAFSGYIDFGSSKVYFYSNTFNFDPPTNAVLVNTTASAQVTSISNNYRSLAWTRIGYNNIPIGSAPVVSLQDTYDGSTNPGQQQIGCLVPAAAVPCLYHSIAIPAAGGIGADYLAFTSINTSGDSVGVRVRATLTNLSNWWAYRAQPSSGNTSGTQTMYEAAWNQATLNVAAGMTAGYGFRARSGTISGGTLADMYGLYIHQQKVTNVTNGWGVFQADTADKNAFFGGTQLGIATLTTETGTLGFAKITDPGTAAGAAGGKIMLRCGTNAGTARLIAYAGTSTTPVTILDNIGSGVTGC